MRRLGKITAENNMLRRKAKGKKTKGGSSSSEDEDSSLEEDVSKKGKKGRNNHDKPSYNSMSFNYDNMPNTTAYTSIPIGKAPYFDGTYYNQWKHCMKNYLYSISPEVCQVVCYGIEFLDEGEQPTIDQLQKIHHNVQAISIITSSIGALHGQHDILLKAHQDLEVQFGALWPSTTKTSINNKASTSQVSVETCYDQIAQENDHLKREAKKVELEVNKLKKQGKVQPPQDNCNNMVKKLEKGKITLKIASQPPKKFKRRWMKKWNMRGVSS
jgi:hypothetical protein